MKDVAPSHFSPASSLVLGQSIAEYCSERFRFTHVAQYKDKLGALLCQANEEQPKDFKRSVR
jgi:hypothetical protein